MTRVACGAKYRKVLSRGGPYQPKLRPSSRELCPDCFGGKDSPGAESAKIAGSNIDKDPIYIEHASLETDHADSFLAACPVCKRGTILGQRDQVTFEILSKDNCVLCGQQFIYRDLGEQPNRLCPPDLESADGLGDDGFPLCAGCGSRWRAHAAREKETDEEDPVREL
jgi:hypothetical protein